MSSLGLLIVLLLDSKDCVEGSIGGLQVHRFHVCHCVIEILYVRIDDIHVLGGTGTKVELKVTVQFNDAVMNNTWNNALKTYLYMIHS